MFRWRIFDDATTSDAVKATACHNQDALENLPRAHMGSASIGPKKAHTSDELKIVQVGSARLPNATHMSKTHHVRITDDEKKMFHVGSRDGERGVRSKYCQTNE